MDNVEKTIQAGEVKNKCLAILDEVNKTGRALVITKHGKPVARLSPIKQPPSLLGSVKYHGDIVAPLDLEWDAAK